MSDDFLDELMRPDGDETEQRDPRSGIAACGTPAESSQQLEEWERAYFGDMKARPLEQIALFYSDNGHLEPLTRIDKAILKTNGVSIDEFLELVGTVEQRT